MYDVSERVNVLVIAIFPPWLVLLRAKLKKFVMQNLH